MRRVSPIDKDNGSIRVVDGSYRLVCDGESFELGRVENGIGVNHWVELVSRHTLSEIVSLSQGKGCESPF